MRSKEEFRSEYHHKVEETVKRKGRLIQIISIIRLLLFVFGLILAWKAFSLNLVAGLGTFTIFFILFLYSVYLYSLHYSHREFLKNVLLLSEFDMNDEWKSMGLFGNGEEHTGVDSDYANDIDLFGKASVFSFINRCPGEAGRKTLASWLNNAYTLSGDIEKRQEAVKGLASRRDWTLEYLAHGVKHPLMESDIEGIKEWLETPAKESTGKGLIVAAYLLPLLTMVSIALSIMGIIQPSAVILFFIINLMVVGIRLRTTNRMHNLISRKNDLFRSMERRFEILGNGEIEGIYFMEIRETIGSGRISANTAIRTLGKIAQAFDSRLNMIAGVLLNGFLLWDLQCIIRLERWKEKWKGRAAEWFRVLAEVEAMASLGIYAGNNPDYTFPVIAEDDAFISTTKMGHPLISEEKRVCNDFSIDHGGSIILVTGANMAGKSTFLRTIAVNWIVAMVGAPVCAAEWSFRPSPLFTSMRTSDSLDSNESYFYAELKRLRSLKEKILNGEKPFFLLDEILKGTNSVDKSNGSRAFLELLMKLGSTGIIATHDLTLTDFEKESGGKVINHCFEIEIDGEEIIFDYILRRGATTRMNASILLRKMGIVEKSSGKANQ